MKQLIIKTEKDIEQLSSHGQPYYIDVFWDPQKPESVNEDMVIEKNRLQGLIEAKFKKIDQQEIDKKRDVLVAGSKNTDDEKTEKTETKKEQRGKWMSFSKLMKQFWEEELVDIANNLWIKASVDDYKKDTAKKIVAYYKTV